MDAVVVGTDAWIVAALLGLAMIVAWGVGWRTGRAMRKAGRQPPESKLDDAALALLGLLLAFTFSIALNKFDLRRERMVADSNAIGDFYTSASLAPEPARTRLQDLIRDYAKLRLQVAMGGWGPELEHALPRFEQMQGRMTELVGEALAAHTTIPETLTQTLNGVTSMHASRLVAVRDHLPGSIVVLLLLAATLTSGLVGRLQGLSPRPSLAGTASFIAIVVLTIYVTLDLNQPAKGLIRINQEPMQRLLNSMTR